MDLSCNDRGTNTEYALRKARRACAFGLRGLPMRARSEMLDFLKGVVERAPHESWAALAREGKALVPCCCGPAATADVADAVFRVAQTAKHGYSTS